MSHFEHNVILHELYTQPCRSDNFYSLLSFLVLKTQTQERLEKKHGDTRAKFICPAAFRRVLHSHLVPSLQQFSLNLCSTTVNYRGYTLFSLSSPWAFHSLFQMLLKGRLFPWVLSREERIHISTTTKKIWLAFTERAASSRLWWMGDQCQDKINPLFTHRLFRPFRTSCKENILMHTWKLYTALEALYLTGSCAAQAYAEACGPSHRPRSAHLASIRCVPQCHTSCKAHALLTRGSATRINTKLIPHTYTL